jgi:hypothetical protein
VEIVKYTTGEDNDNGFSEDEFGGVEEGDDGDPCFGNEPTGKDNRD